MFMPSITRFPAKVAAIFSMVAIAPLGIFATTLSAEAANFSQIYTFGDSLVDTGNTFELTGGFPPAPYFEGRFANGPLWTEYLAEGLGVSRTNFGFSGAQTSDAGFSNFGVPESVAVPGLSTQVNGFTQNAADPDALYILWAGANDYLFGGVTDPTEPVGNLVGAVNQLAQAGAKNFLLPNQPDIGTLPFLGLTGASDEAIAGLNQLSELHNQGLAAAVAALDATDINAQLLDANALIRQAQAGKLGFDNTTGSCILTPGCVGNKAVESSFLFWDPAHPSSRAHFIVAEAAQNQLKGKKVSTPEPGALLELLLLSGFAAVAVKRDSFSA